MLNVVEKAKWQAWNSLKSTSKEEAASKYVELVSELVSKEQAAAPTSPSTESRGDLEVVLDQGGVLKLYLNRPSKKNAITPEMYVEWTKTLNEAATNPGVKLVSVTGKGDYFSSGNDLNTFVKSIANGGSLTEMAKDARALLHRFVSAFIDFPKPLIGLINGPAVGIAVTTLGLYDYILASDTATFHTPFVALGQSPEGCSSYTFPRLMGTMKVNGAFSHLG
ncbi:unnamed protein product [Dicrocoelium dendriticum]|nr:unnamed protein product [Dicrocoelium dendriticum]